MVTETSDAAESVVIKTLLVSGAANNLAAFADGLGENGQAELRQTASGSEAAALLEEQEFDLVVIDEQLDDQQGLKFLTYVAKNRPFANTVLVSELSHDDFHEVTEGMGVLMQLSNPPAKEDAVRVLNQIKKILSLHIG